MIRPDIYSKPPTSELDLRTFIRLGEERTEMLRSLQDDNLSRMGRVEKLKTIADESKVSSELDLASHFIVRLALCEEEWQSNWLVRAEMNLLRIRFDCCSPSERTSFLDDSMGVYINSQEKGKKDLFDAPVRRKSISDLKEVLGPSRIKWLREDQDILYEMPFEAASSLVKERQVLIVEGRAYIPRDLLFSFLCEWFSNCLRNHMQILRRASQARGFDSRLHSTFSAIRKRIKRPLKYKRLASKEDGKLTRRSVPELARQSFPLCMKQMYRKLNDHSHLRYMGRRTFGLFLKGIGLSLEESLEFWRESFTPRFSYQEWRSKYSYNIKHNYGKVGKCADYDPYDCSKIIGNSLQGPNEYHSCPFKYFDTLNLQRALQHYNVGSDYVGKILELTKLASFGQACKEFFKSQHDLTLIKADLELDEVGRHPNAYHDQSRRYFSILRKDSLNISSEDA